MKINFFLRIKNKFYFYPFFSKQIIKQVNLIQKESGGNPAYISYCVQGYQGIKWARMVACSKSHHTQFSNVFLFVSVSQTHLQACQESFLGPTNMLLMYFFSLAAAVLCCASSKQKPTTLT